MSEHLPITFFPQPTPVALTKSANSLYIFFKEHARSYNNTAEHLAERSHETVLCLPLDFSAAFYSRCNKLCKCSSGSVIDLHVKAGEKGKMRIVGGQARGRTLHAPPGNITRPTSDRVREALFSVVESRLGNLAGTSVLDLFAGSGALGIEAISRGAAHVVFVDRSPACQKIIQSNTSSLGFERHCTILKRDVVSALPWMERQKLMFDLVLADPPYAEDPKALLLALSQRMVLKQGGLLVLEHSRRQEPEEDEEYFALITRKTYGDTLLSFYRRAETQKSG